MGTLKEKITRAVSEHVSLEDTYTYELTRAKSAFSAGTMSLEDFEEWSETNVDKLAEDIVNALQPQLSKRQLKMLHDLKANYRCHDNSVEWAIYDFLVEDEYEKMQNNELLEVLDAFKKWVQEEE